MMAILSRGRWVNSGFSNHGLCIPLNQVDIDYQWPCMASFLLKMNPCTTGRGYPSEHNQYLTSELDIAFHVVVQQLSKTMNVIKWKHFLRYRPFVRGIHRSTLNSPHKGQWRGALMFSLICSWMNDWVNNRETGDLRRHHVHYDVTVMAHKQCATPVHAFCEGNLLVRLLQ